MRQDLGVVGIFADGFNLVSKYLYTRCSKKCPKEKQDEVLQIFS